MGGGGGGDGGAAQREKERQDRIAQGYEEIRKIFDGYSRGVGDVAAPELNAAYYMADGTPVSVREVMVPNPAYANWQRAKTQKRGPAPAAQIAQRQLFKQGSNKGIAFDDTTKLFSGTEYTPGFDDNFFAQREQAYQQFATPQLEDQYAKAQEDLMMALARTGRLQSSTRGERFGELQRDFDIQKTNVADKARQYAGDARSQVESARADLVALNNSVADPTAIAQQAQLSSSAMRSAPAFDPLAPLFQNVTEGIATQAELERRNAARYNTGFFAPSLNRGSGRNVRG